MKVKSLEGQVAGPHEPPNVVALHPQSLAAGLQAGDPEANEAMRDLIETVTVYRDDARPGSVQVTMAGRPNALLGEKAFPNGIRAVGGLMVAEEGFEPPTQGL